MVVFGGDDLTSVVLDVGSHSIRSGLSGEDLPKSDILSCYSSANGHKQWGTSALLPKPNAEYHSIIGDGVWTDPSAINSLLPFVLDGIKGSAESLPVCLLESGFNSSEQKNAICESIFEGNLAPAVYIAKNAVTASFALGKPTSLVVDIGAEFVVVTPVVDGFVLKNNVMKSRVAGNSLTRIFEEFLSARNYSPTILQEIGAKVAVNAEQLPNVVLKLLPGVTESYRDLHRKESTLFVAENGDNVAENSKGMKSYEFPDGYNFPFQVCPLSEHLFTASDDNNLGIAELIHRCISGCDVDLRPQLVSNVVLCGGGASIPGLLDRLSFELSKFYSPAKLKFSFLGTSYEKRFTSWIGGSILCSMGTFQQMWVTRKDYEEHGANLANTKFL